MSLSSGTRLGAYTIVAPLGAGGMGEVYRARDTKLQRDIAVKVLPDLFAGDPERLARFEREAQSLAALNHPHIAQVFAVLEDPPALAMELVEGEDLSQRIARGAIPTDEALPIARQIADALEAAHSQGIVHRDLKPANIKLRPDGTVKVLDFGLAKAMEPTDSSPGRFELSPTFTSPAMTQMGVILGTAAYMSPEQARGRAVDKRADIWAFGCVVYEMLTGRQAFSGDSVTDLIAGIVKEDPDWSALPAGVPQTIRQLLQRCLRKDPRQRLHDIGDARLDIEEAIANPQTAAERVPAISVASRRTVIALMAVVAVLLLVSGYLAWLASRPAAAPPVTRFRVTTPGGAEMPRLSWTMTALSPDGRYLAVNAGRDPDAHIYLRPLDDVEMKLVPGTKHGYNPFFSADGKWIAFTAEQKLRRVPVAGGQSHVICDAEWGGGTWGAGDVIVFTPNYASGLWKVAASGGKPEKLTDPNPGAGELGHWWPQFLPDGRHVVFTSFSTPIEKSRVMLYSLDTGAQRMLVEGAMFGRVLSSGHLVYARADGILGAPFDLRRGELTGPEAPVLDGVSTYLSNGVAQMSVASNGTLAFIPANEVSANTELVWVDRGGSVTQALPARRRHVELRLSPDGRRLALTIEDGNRDVWTYDFERGVLGRVTSGAAGEFGSRWTPDGKRIAFASEKPVFQVFIKHPSSNAAEEPLVTENYDAEPMAISPDGQFLVYTLNSPATRSDLWIKPLTAGDKGKPLIATKYAEEGADISPDGRWITYTSDESGRPEVYVQAFPDATDRWQVTTDGAVSPRWSAAGRELYYAAGLPERLVSVPISPTASGIVVGTPSTVFEGRFDGYDVAPDGRVLVLRKDPKAAPPSIHVVLNWFEDLKQKLPE